MSAVSGRFKDRCNTFRQAGVGIAVSTATGLTNIVALVEQGRTIYQRILTWIINKISRTILKAAFVAWRGSSGGQRGILLDAEPARDQVIERYRAGSTAQKDQQHRCPLDMRRPCLWINENFDDCRHA